MPGNINMWAARLLTVRQRCVLATSEVKSEGMTSRLRRQRQGKGKTAASVVVAVALLANTARDGLHAKAQKQHLHGLNNIEQH